MLMRHAKSSWGDASLPDFERPLNDRGEADAKRVGANLLELDRKPDVILSSTAERARQTALILANEIGETQLIFVPELYGATPGQILSTIQSAPDNCNRLLVIAHNPGMGELAEILTGEYLPEGMKTAAIAAIKIDESTWSNVESGALEWVLYPRDL